MPDKRCFKCSEVKSLDEFYVHSRMADGHLNKCKECAKRDVRARYYAKPDEMKAYRQAREKKSNYIASRKRYLSSPKGQAKRARCCKRHRLAHPDRAFARQTLSNAVRDGRVSVQPCEVCGCTVGVEAHHVDYSRPLDVHWFCFKHHKEAHGKSAMIDAHPGNHRRLVVSEDLP